MMAFRVRLEKMRQQKYYEIEESNNPHDDIHNCQILHYSRRNPKTGQIAAIPMWMRSICPWNTSLSSNEWQPIIREEFTNEQLLQEVLKHRQLVDTDEGLNE
jgi:hypothetical protein